MHIKPMTAIVNTAICLQTMMEILLSGIAPVIGSVLTGNARKLNDALRGMSMEKDYSVTWNDIKNRVEKWLKEKRGIDGDMPISMGTIDYAMTMVWHQFCDEKDRT